MRSAWPVCKIEEKGRSARFLAVAVFVAIYGAAAAQTYSSASHSNSASGQFQSLAVQANAARDAQQLDKAAALYHQALAVNPRWTEGWWSLATIDYDANRYAEGAIAFHKVVALDPRDGTARAMLGLCEFELGQDANALRDIEASKSLGIAEDEQLRQVVLYHEGVLLQRLGRFEAAQAALASLCLSGVQSQELIQTFGMVALRMRDRKTLAAGSAAAEVVERIGAGACLAGQKNYDAARKEYESVVASNPHFPYVHYAYGRFLLDARDSQGAIREFKLQTEETPNDILSWLRIASVEYKVNSAAGIPYATEAVRRGPNIPLAHYLLGLLLLDTGDYQKALPQLEIARKAFPQDGKIYLSLAVAYAHVGRPQDSARARAEFLRLRQSAGSEQQNTNPDQSTYGVPEIEMMNSAGVEGRP